MSEYTSPSAVVRAISDVAKSQAKEVGGNTAAIVEMEYRNRLLTRVFAASDPSWVLKGGTSTLVRLPDARATKDIDLLRESGTLEAAIEELKKLAALDLGDFFRFTLLTIGPILEGEGQGAREGAVLVFDVYCGQKKLNRVSVDLVVSRTPLTSAVEVGEPPLAKKLPMLPHRLYRLYPLVSQIAEKACAMVETHFANQPSTRSKDLVDIVTYASTQQLESSTLRQAVIAEARLRGLSSVDFAGRVPARDWIRQYKEAANRIPHCNRHPTVIDAVELVRDFIDEAVMNQNNSQTWSPQALRWE